MYKLNFKKRVWIVKQYLKGVPTKHIASAQKVSTRTVQILVKDYKIRWRYLKRPYNWKTRNSS